jgi:hypothetical protein
MALRSIWRRFTARRRRRDSFYDTQDVMRRAIASEAEKQKQTPTKSADSPKREGSRGLAAPSLTSAFKNST